MTFDTNVGGTVNVLEAVRLTPSVKVLVNITSDKCCENKEWVWGYRENDPMGGHDLYSASKGCAELVFNAYLRSFFSESAAQNRVIGAASARAGNVIGGGDWGDGSWNDLSDPQALHEAKLLKLNCDKAHTGLNWHSVLTIDESLQMTADWYKEFYSEPQTKDMYQFCVVQIRKYGGSAATKI